MNRRNFLVTTGFAGVAACAHGRKDSAAADGTAPPGDAAGPRASGDGSPQADRGGDRTGARDAEPATPGDTAGGGDGDVSAGPVGWARVSEIEARIVAPRFANRDFVATDFGAVGDGRSDALPALTIAIDACSRAGGGRVVVPPGAFVVNGSVHLKSNVDLHVSAGAFLLFGGSPDDYLPGDAARGGTVPVRWEGTRCYNYSPPIYAHGQENIAVTGAGIIDGQTSRLWAAWKDLQGPDQAMLRTMGQTGVPVERRVFGRGHHLRPPLVQFYGCRNVLIEGVTLRGSPFWTMNPVLCQNLTIRKVTVEPGTTNDDGCDPESCRDVLLDGIVFSRTNDDNIAIKAGRDSDAWAENGGRPCENVIIRNCRLARGAPGGISIGSEMSGGVRNVFIEDCAMGSVDNALYIKSNPERGGTVEQIWMRHCDIDSCASVLVVEGDYKKIATGAYPPTIRDVHVEDVTCRTASGTAFRIGGLPDSPVTGVSLRNVAVGAAAVPSSVTHAREVSFTNVTVGGRPVVARLDRSTPARRRLLGLGARA